MADDPVEELVRNFQDRIVSGTWKGLCGLDEASFDGVMACQATSCAQAYVQLFQIPDTLDLDAFLERMALGGSSKIEFQRDGNTILWNEIHGGECMCPLVKRGVVPLEPGLCRCAVHWVRDLRGAPCEGPRARSTPRLRRARLTELHVRGGGGRPVAAQHAGSRGMNGAWVTPRRRRRGTRPGDDFSYIAARSAVMRQPRRLA